MIAFQIGPFTVAYYGIMIVTGVIAATLVSLLEARRKGEDTQHLYNILLVILPLGFIGARAYHVIDQWAYYSQHPAQIFGGAGLGIFGAVIGGAIGLTIYAIVRKLNVRRWLDIVAPGVILAQAIGRWGNFFNQELYGYPTDLPWGIYIAPEHRVPGFETYTHFQPLFFYEFLWNLSGCIFLLLVARKLQKRLVDGDIALLYVMWYGVGRFFLEGLKISVWTLEGIPTARWISAIGIAVAVLIMILQHRRQKPAAAS
ncbi:MAG: prolipoprotein diacylglyceryl transferase [Chloroflexi bacterium]|nr:prolipoprotein diacylglyceryl transferase [Chloroflexota bacterium]